MDAFYNNRIVQAIVNMFPYLVKFSLFIITKMFVILFAIIIIAGISDPSQTIDQQYHHKLLRFEYFDILRLKVIGNESDLSKFAFQLHKMNHDIRNDSLTMILENNNELRLCQNYHQLPNKFVDYQFKIFPEKKCLLQIIHNIDDNIDNKLDDLLSLRCVGSSWFTLHIAFCILSTIKSRLNTISSCLLSLELKKMFTDKQMLSKIKEQFNQDDYQLTRVNNGVEEPVTIDTFLDALFSLVIDLPKEKINSYLSKALAQYSPQEIEKINYIELTVQAYQKEEIKTS